MLSPFIVLTSYLAWISAIAAVSAFPLQLQPSTVNNTTVRSLHIFPNGTAAENLHVRKDGSILLTVLYPSAGLYLFPTSRYDQPILLYNFTGSAAAYGITEYAPDIFAVYTGTFSRSGTITNATGIIWRVDLARFRIQPNGTVTSPARVSRLSSLSNVGFLNGAATLDADTILAADSVQGVVYAIDTSTGNYSVTLNDTALAPNATGAVRLGVNGLAKVNDTLYFTNTNKRTVGKVRLNVDGTAASPYTTVASNVLVDDLDVDHLTGEVYIASLVANAITYVSPNGTASVIAGSLNSTDIPGPTAIKFARESGGCQGGISSRRLFISTSGGYEYPINGTYIQGGGLYELKVT